MSKSEDDDDARWLAVLAAPLVFVLARALRLPTPAAICAGLVAALSPWQSFMSRIALPPTSAHSRPIQPWASS